MANILVIDDDRDIQRLLEFTLKRAGHIVEASSDGLQGLTQAEMQEPDLIVCDVMMPRMTGYEFCKRARAKPVLKETPIIVFSARFQPVDRQTALDAGATDYLAKTTDPALLVKRIEELLPGADAPKPYTAKGMVALFSLRGGTGVTSLAVNLAIAVAVSQETKVSLVDLAALGGHTALMLGVRPTSNVSQLLATDTAEFSSETIEPHYIQHSSGVRLLASAPGFHRNLSLADDRLLRLIQGLKSASPLTVLDVPHMLEPHFAPVLKLLDRVILLLSSDMPSVQSTAIALQGLVSLGMADSQIRLVINQLSASNTLPVETIQRVLKRPILGTIPFDPNMLAAVNSGKPLLLSNPKSPAAKAISQLAEKLFTS